MLILSFVVFTLYRLPIN